LFVKDTRRRADPVDVACAVADDAVFCYLSVLAFHGLEHNLTTRTQFYVRHQIPRFGYDGQSYVPCRAGGGTVETRSVLTASGRARGGGSGQR
jgi:hypothetical protein